MITSWQRYAKDHPRVVDVVVIVQLFAAVALGSAFTTAGNSRTNGSLGLGVLLGGIACVALLWHRSHPRTVVAVTAICGNTAGAAGYLLTPLLLAPVMAALYWLAVHTDRRTARVHCIAVTALLVTTATLFDPYGHPLALKTIGPAAWVVLPIVWGTASRLRSAYLEAVQSRAEHAERTREEEARHRVAEERMRIARELHDVVAHHMALANALAGTAAHLAASRPEQTERILADLVGTTSTALRELKATVGLLRRPDDSEAPLEPAPGLGRLTELATAFASAGLTVDIVTEGERRPLSPGVDLTAFRIVQEALTNVTKHAAARAAQVTLTYTHDRLTITVTDDGSGDTPVAPSPSGGFGLIGMRERARSVGGRVRTGPRPEGGFSVTGELPIHL
ncbi:MULTISPECIES: sensor histidine kinase [unclassified Streptomyces]|uniref:sensor histidine kinase n=1 Tax=unclassified Streptomyces TaxID=2593676 RepID=UPI00117C54E2|nr:MULTISPECIES: sensor histidine kinase [unclassified Streptomyces]TRO63172.1 sensor histidine kinase [Streptomyces sp. IB201691-2A2]